MKTMTKIKLLPHALSNLRIEDRFYSKASQLRNQFTARFENPYSTQANRFCWDYWEIPEHYRLLRTPAESFFGKKEFAPFLSHLLEWGRQNLGCQMISHPWLSAYFDGCYQSLHSDVPHGPWSFVYSLTPWQNRKFTGGETLLAKPKLLRYFQDIDSTRSDEQAQFFQKIEPQFNRLTVFDPRYPHGVQQIKGEENLLASRLVIHGWFTEPRPMIEGSLTFKQILKPLDSLAISILGHLEPLKYTGLLSIKIEILPSGAVSQLSILCGHLTHPLNGEIIPAPLLKKLLLSHFVKNEKLFPKSSGKTWLTLPLEFNR